MQGGMTTMRILVVTNLYPTAERPFMSTFVKEQVESMREHCPDLTIDVHVIEGYRPKGEYLREMLRLPAIVKRGRYDIVHAHFGLTLVSLLLVRAPVVVTFHGSDLLVNPTKHVSRLLAPKASKVIVVAQRLRDYLGYGEVIPCGIQVKNFILPPCHEDKPSPRIPGELKVLFPSNPAYKVKDYGLFQAVCQELERRGNKVEEVHLMNINRANVPEVYWNCDLMLLTSLSEGSPTIIKEAIAAKLPFVSVDVGDVKEWTELVEFGVVVPDREPKTIADAVVALLTRIKPRPLLDNSKCLEALDLANIARRIRGVYDEVLEKNWP
jgi:glycosyltransferase involved in cell wall biosynthesis